MFNASEFDTQEGINKATEKLKQWTEKQQELKSQLAVSKNNLETSQKKLEEMGFGNLDSIDALLTDEIAKRDTAVSEINKLIESAKE